MHYRYYQFAASLAILGSFSAPAGAESLWQRFAPVQKVSADPGTDYSLSQENGPWHVMAATFTGDGGPQQARDLALELRSRFNLPAYVHQMSFSLDDGEDVGRGIDKYGAKIKMKYQKDQVQEWAVLVGDFPTVDDPSAQQLLETVKSLKPNALSTEGGKETFQSMAHVRKLEAMSIERLGNDKALGPMRTAFVTRNPILPKEYFVPKGVDPFVAKMNKGVEHSLLDCPGKYTIQVAHFEGKVVIQGATSTGSARRKKREEQDPLVVAAENAHLLTVALRAKGWDAYEYHDRTESVVTIGGFENAERGEEGILIPTGDRERKIIQIFGAAYDTPFNPMLGDTDATDQARAQEVTSKFNQLFTAQHGQTTGGLKPKYLEVLQGRFITFDVYPHAMEVPRKTVSGAFAAWR